MNDRLRRMQIHPALVLGPKKQELLARSVRVIDFGSAEPQEPMPQNLQDAVARGAAEVAAGKLSRRQGQAGVRAAAAEYLQRRFGVRLDPERQILLTFGSTEAVFHLPMSFVQVPSDKDLVLYGEPSWQAFELGALFAEAWTYAVPGGGTATGGMRPDAVPESVLRRAAVVCLGNPQNPTGALLTADRMRAWVEAREEYGFVLLSDESCIDLYGDERPHSLLEQTQRGVLCAHSLTLRSGFSGCHVGFMAGDPELLAQYGRFRTGMGIAPPDLILPAAALAWRDDAHVAARRAELQQKRAVLTDCLRQRGVEVPAGGAGPFLWVQAPNGVGGRDYAAQCLEQGILVVPGIYLGDRTDRFVRIALGPTLADCQQAAKVWPRPGRA